MSMINGGHYEAVRYSPSFNYDRPFSIVASKYDGSGTFVTEMSFDEACDLHKSLDTLLYHTELGANNAES